MSQKHRLILTLADGQRFVRDVPKMPRHWKSWLMQQTPYGTPMQGAQFSRQVIS